MSGCKRTFVPLALTIAWIPFVSPVAARAQNLVHDGGFEQADALADPTTANTTLYTSGSIDGGYWNVTAGQVGVDTHTEYVFAGNKSLYLTADGFVPSSVTQTLTTVVGQEYLISFYANADASNAAGVLFDGNFVSGFPLFVTQNGFSNNYTDYPADPSTFTLYSGYAIATSTSTDLTLIGAIDGGPGDNTLEVDNVSVTAVPEPGTYALLGSLGVTGAAFLRRRRAR